MKRPTKRQLEVLRAIYSLTMSSPLIPTLNEIGEAVGVMQPQAVQDHIRALRHKGLVTRGVKRSARTTVITRRGLGAIGIVHINQGEVCGWCGAHYFGPECPFARCHEEAVGW